MLDHTRNNVSFQSRQPSDSATHTPGHQQIRDIYASSSPNSSPSVKNTPHRKRSKGKAWGDPITELNEDDFRVLFQNINGLYQSPVTHEEVKLNMAR